MSHNIAIILRLIAKLSRLQGCGIEAALAARKSNAGHCYDITSGG